MDLHRSLEDLESVLDKEIRTVTQKGTITPQELENMTKAVCLIEKIKEYREFMPAQDGEYSNRGSYAMPYSRIYDNGSYRRMYDNGSYDRGYYDDHRYSRHSIKDRMISKLESMYDEAKTDHERQIVDEWIRRIGSES